MANTDSKTEQLPVLAGVEAQLFVADIPASCAFFAEKLGFTQSEVAARASVTREWLVRFENGKATVPMTRVFDVLGALGLTVEVDVSDA